MNPLNTDDCKGCQKRKEYLVTMLTDHRFWLGIIVGVGGTYVYHKYAAKKMG